MIGVLAPNIRGDAAALVLAALRRSVTRAQASSISLAGLDYPVLDTLVVVDLPESWASAILAWYGQGNRRLILFGHLPPALISVLEAVPAFWPRDPAGWSRSEPAPTHQSCASPANIQYTPLVTRLGGDEWSRALERFDFTNEWNNLGYGAIRADGSIWALSIPLRVPDRHELASLTVDGKRYCSYAALFDHQRGSLLWFNRPVGPIDSFEWHLVEQFIANYRSLDVPCHPVLREIPLGYDAAITMRLDCDEDVESACQLWNAYREIEVPFSLAVHTSNLTEARHHPILRELVAAGGSVLSHTSTHAPNWGGSYETALSEAAQSSAALEAVTGRPVSYAVSPFHQTPHYALAALADAGYRGCIGGVIGNDPEFVLARGGELAGLPRGFVGHSQQCMLHGDCMLTGDDPLRVFKQAFDQAMATHTLFGYLDHPFSERYAYGWPDENARIERHCQLVNYIRSQVKTPLFLAENDALNFLRAKSSINLMRKDDGFVSEEQMLDFPVAFEFRGECRQVVTGELIA